MGECRELQGNNNFETMIKTYKLKLIDERWSFIYDIKDGDILHYHSVQKNNITKNLKEFDIQHDFEKQNVHLSKRENNILITVKFFTGEFSQVLITPETKIDLLVNQIDWLYDINKAYNLLKLRDAKTLQDLMP